MSQPAPEHTLRACQRAVDEWIADVGVRYFSELTNTAVLMEEVGELARIMARTFGEQSFKEGEEADLGMEMADVLFVLVCLANQTGVDLEESFQRALAKKDPTRPPASRGKSQTPILIYVLMLRLVGAPLVVALVGFRWLHTRCRMGAHKGRSYIDRFGTVGGGLKPPPTDVTRSLSSAVSYRLLSFPRTIQNSVRSILRKVYP